MKLSLKFLAVSFIFLSMAMHCEDGLEYVYIKGIEACNINNEGGAPFVTIDPIKKEAFMIGIKWFTEDRYDYEASNIKLMNISEKKIFCTNNFDADHPSGSDVSGYFKKAKYTPSSIDEGFVLLTAPKPGEYSFQIIFYGKDGSTFEYNTPLINLY